MLAVAQDESGRLAPVCGWVLRRSRAHIAAVVERIRAAYPFTPAPPPAQGSRNPWTDPSGPADFVGMYHELEQATLFAPERTWRIRPPAEHQRVSFGGIYRHDIIVVRFIDLADQTFLGLTDIGGGMVYVRARADLLEPLPAGGPYHPDDSRSSQAGSDVRVLRGRLAEILSPALDASGAGDPDEIGTLAEAVQPRPVNLSDPKVLPVRRS